MPGTRGDGPRNRKGGVIPDYSRLRFGRIRPVYFVKNLGIRLQGTVPMCKARGNKQLLTIDCGKSRRDKFSVCGGFFPQIDSYIVDRAAQCPHEFCLSGRGALKM